MFFSESERLLELLPDLAKQIQQLDGVVHRATLNGEFCATTSFVASCLRVDRFDATAILDYFVDAGLLQRCFATVCSARGVKIRRYLSVDEIPLGPISCDVCMDEHPRDNSQIAVVYVTQKRASRPFEEGDAGVSASPSFTPEALPHVHDSLSAYSETPTGRERLSSRSILCLVTAIELERLAVEAVLERREAVVAPGTLTGGTYYRGFLPALDGEHEVVLGVLASMGNNLAGIATSTMIATFRPKRVVLVGIAGGVPSPEDAESHVRLGDVVLLSKDGVRQYDLGKQKADEWIERSPPRAPGRLLLEASGRLVANQTRNERPWNAFIGRTNPRKRPKDTEDVLHDGAGNHVPHPADPRRVRGEPRLFLGTIASGNAVVKSRASRELLRARCSALAVEMEGAGVADAAWYSNVEMTIVRGICDYCDEHKNDVWQPHAAECAAAVAKALVQQLSVQY